MAADDFLPRNPYGDACDAWPALQRDAQRLRGAPNVLSAQDGTREAAGLFLDFTRQILDGPACARLLALAQQAGVPAWTEALFAGLPVNVTEKRAALHMALRSSPGSAMAAGADDVMPQVLAVRRQMAELVRRVHAGEWRGFRGEPIRDVVNIGIGGSDLGPVMAVEALHAYRRPGLGVHFVSNIDGVQAVDVVATLDPATTLFVVCSKSFTTQETQVNAHALRAWLHAAGGDDAVRGQFVAVSTNQAAMDEFGIAPENRFTMWDWVGGRYSLWSAVGLSVALAVGWEHFEALLAGAHDMDEHFAHTPLRDNLPVLLALLGVWNQNFLDCDSHAVLPYDQRLHRLPAYLQQLEMESNGKGVSRDGQSIAWQTGAVLWGEPGSNAQHSFYQLLHQGTRRVHVDFIAPVHGSGMPDQQEPALANLLAQAEALFAGYGPADVDRELSARGLAPGERSRLRAHKVHPGGRASTLLLMERLDPRRLGALVALYEHKVFVQSVIWGINPFDQWGVELGKKLAQRTASWLAGAQDAPPLPALEYIRRQRASK